MRDLMIVTATLCAVCGLILGAMSILLEHREGWRSGFVSGCFAMALTVLLGAVVAAWTM